jgi:hypothetical protein
MAVGWFNACLSSLERDHGKKENIYRYFIYKMKIKTKKII